MIVLIPNALVSEVPDGTSHPKLVGGPDVLTGDTADGPVQPALAAVATQATPAPPAERPAAEPAEAGPDAIPAQRTGESADTPFGLPRRVRQASIAAPLRVAAPATAEEPSGRPPEQLRQMMASYQAATVRGRADADPDRPPAEGPAAESDPSDPSDPSEPEA